MAKKEEVVVVNETALEVRETGAVTTTGAPRGMENVDITTITMPIAKLLQPTSPEVQDEDYEFKAGQVIHSLFMEKLPDLFVPIMVSDTNVLFVPKNDADKIMLKNAVREKFGAELTDDDMSGMFICRAQDGKHGDRFGKCADCQLNKFRGNEKPLCTATINFLSIFEGQDSPVVVRFANTSYKHGKRLKDLIFLSRQDTFARKYKLIPTKITKDGNTFYEATVKPAGKPTPEEFELAELLYNSFQGVNIEVQDETNVAPEGDFIEY